MQSGYNPINIHATTTYFAAIGRYAGDPHNFVILGCDNGYIQKDNRHDYHILASQGKTGSIQSASISNERVFYKTQTRYYQTLDFTVHYQAYEITFQQYQQHIDLLDRLSVEQTRKNQKPKYFSYYYPTTNVTQLAFSRSGYNQRPLAETNEYQPSPQLQNYASLSPGNTCRHTALDFMANTGIKDPGISRFFLGRLANKLRVLAGMITTPLFILPPPVNLDLKNAAPLQFKLLTDLRKGLVRLSKSRYNSDDAVHKVNALRYLFNRINHPDLTTENIIDIINHWNSETSPLGNTNQDLIATQRRTFWCRLFNPEKTSSTKLVEKMLLTLGKASPAPGKK